MAVVTDPADYARLAARDEGRAAAALGFADALRARGEGLRHTAEYDGMISNWLTARDATGARARFPDA